MDNKNNVGKKTFIRFEEKFLISREQYDILSKFLLKYMKYDNHSDNNYFYQVYNLYLDTEDYHMIRTSITMPPYKEKIRIRGYHCDENPNQAVFIEIKKKINGLIVKRRISVTFEEAMDLIYHKNDPVIISDNAKQIYQEIKSIFDYNILTPKVMVAYERLAFIGKENGELRITFDRNMVSRKTNLTSLCCEGEPFIDPDQYLLEIKSTNNFPLWLVRKLQDLNIRSERFSKYATAYKYYITGVRQ